MGGDKLSHLQQLKTLTLTWFTSSGQPPLNCSWLRQTPSFSAGCDVHCVLDIWTFTTWCYVKTVSQWTAVCTLFLLARGQLKRWIGNCHKVAKPTDSARGCQPSPVSQTPATWHPSLHMQWVPNQPEAFSDYIILLDFSEYIFKLNQSHSHSSFNKETFHLDVVGASSSWRILSDMAVTRQSLDDRQTIRDVARGTIKNPPSLSLSFRQALFASFAPSTQSTIFPDSYRMDGRGGHCCSRICHLDKIRHEIG